MKPMYLLIAAIVVGEGLFLGFTNYYEKDQEEKKYEMVEIEEIEEIEETDICDYHQFALNLGPDHFTSSFSDQYPSNREVTFIVRYNQLSVSFEDLVQIPANLYQVVENKGIDCIHTVNFTQNYLTEIPAVIGKMPYVNTLTLSYNKIRELKMVEGLSNNNIKTLTLSGNPIQVIGKEITQFPNLENLNLRNMTELETITEDIKQLKKLKNIVIKGSKIVDDHPQVRKLNRWLPDVSIYWYTAS